MMQLWVLAVLAVLLQCGPASGASVAQSKLRKVSMPAHYDADLPLPRVTHELGQMEMRPERRAGRRLGVGESELTPLFPGYGTHFAYAYVGTPPQRQSLIVDTGSHFTAFPCVGCVNHYNTINTINTMNTIPLYTIPLYHYTTITLYHCTNITL
jgi:hypothetical protein